MTRQCQRAEGNMNSVCCRGAGHITSPEHTEILAVLLSVVRKTADQLAGGICHDHQRPRWPTRFAMLAAYRTIGMINGVFARLVDGVPLMRLRPPAGTARIALRTAQMFRRP